MLTVVGSPLFGRITGHLYLLSSLFSKLLTVYIFCPAILLPRVYRNKAFTNTQLFAELLFIIKIINNLNVHHHESESVSESESLSVMSDSLRPMEFSKPEYWSG